MGTIATDPALFGSPDRVDWNTPAELAESVAAFFDAQGVYWMDPCANEESILTPNLAVLLPTEDRIQLQEYGVARGVLNLTGEHRYFHDDVAREYRLADGLALDWDAVAGGFYCNPPYGYALGPKGCEYWVNKAAACVRASGLLLLPARTETKIWQSTIFPRADAICFVSGRLTFRGAEAPAPFPSALIYFGEAVDIFCEFFAPWGRVVVGP